MIKIKKNFDNSEDLMKTYWFLGVLQKLDIIRYIRVYRDNTWLAGTIYFNTYERNENDY